MVRRRYSFRFNQCTSFYPHICLSRFTNNARHEAEYTVVHKRANARRHIRTHYITATQRNICSASFFTLCIFMCCFYEHAFDKSFTLFYYYYYNYDNMWFFFLSFFLFFNYFGCAHNFRSFLSGDYCFARFIYLLLLTIHSATFTIWFQF